MYVRGSDQNVEYKRPVDGFFRGIVINNEDPNSLMRVKAFIPELVNFNFIEEANVKGDTLKFGAPQMNTALDGALINKLNPLVPWAEQAAGLFGEAGSSHWNSPAQQQWTKTNYGNTTSKTSTFNFAKLNKRKAGWGKGRGSLMGREAQGDATANPTPGDVWTTKKHGLGSLNPSGFGYGPVNSGPRASGVYGVPQVGSQVWIFHEQGNVNFPIYFAAVPAYKETAQVFRNGTGGGPFENGSGNTPAGGPAMSSSEDTVISGKVHVHPGGQRRLTTLNSDLLAALNAGADRANGVAHVEVYSPGQPELHSHGSRTGSHRHDDQGAGGMAADFRLIDMNGNQIPFTTPTGREQWAAFADGFRDNAVRQNYIISGGAAPGYMGTTSVHFDIAAGRVDNEGLLRNRGVRGQQFIWGAGGHEDALTPGWLYNSFQGAVGSRTDPDLPRQR